MTKMKIKIFYAIVIFLIAHCVAIGQQRQPVTDIFERFLAPKTTDKAAQQLLRRAKSDPAARKYVAEHLPSVIEKGPKEADEPWLNAVRLAGELKMSEATSALTRWVSLQTHGTVTMATWARLDRYPAAKALSQIGTPALPALAGVLEHGIAEERNAATRALDLIGSSEAKNILQKHLNEEQDPELRALIKNILDHWRPTS
jgi:hypothetical protein